MTKLTIRKRGRRATAKGNTPQQPQSPKRVSNKNNRASKAMSNQNKASKTNHYSEDSEDSEDSETESVPVKDISQETYILHKSVVVGETVVVSDTDFLKHEEFNFREFQTHNIRKVDDAAKNGGFEFEYISGTATLSAQGVRVMDNIVIAVEDNHGWNKVEKGIE
jgi:hypothetical protein